jgi:hypothetical protein
MMPWKKSTFCESSGCAEVSWPEEKAVYLRDSKDPNGPVLQFSSKEWLAFVAGIKAREFDL